MKSVFPFCIVVQVTQLFGLKTVSFQIFVLALWKTISFLFSVFYPL